MERGVSGKKKEWKSAQGRRTQGARKAGKSPDLVTPKAALARGALQRQPLELAEDTHCGLFIAACKSSFLAALQCLPGSYCTAIDTLPVLDSSISPSIFQYL